MIMQVENITVAAAADRLGVSSSRLRQICREFSIGQKVTDRMRLLTESEVYELETILNRIDRAKVGGPRGPRSKNF